MAEATSKPRYELRTVEDVRVEMDDGVELVADVYRPDADGEYPALLTMHPYGKDNEKIEIDSYEYGEGASEFAIIEAGDSEFWARRGYVHVIVDVRGCGKSGGSYYNLMSDREARDGHDLVEWIADRPWCDGNVGMVGTSYLAFIQYRVAAQQPPHLEAIFPHDGWADTYRDIMYHGGIQSAFSLGLSKGIAATDPVSVSRELYSGEELERRVEELLADGTTNLDRHPMLYENLLVPDVNPLVFDFLVNREDNEFYAGRRPADGMDRIEVPTYLSSELHYHAVMHLPGAAHWGWENVTAEKKLAFRERVPGRPFVDNHEEMLRWFDEHLKDRDTGIMDEPPVKVWVRGAEEFRYADEWPLESETAWTDFHLRTGGKLKRETPAQGSEPPGTIEYEAHPPGGLYREATVGPEPDHLVYETAPFEEPLEVIGPIELDLHASLSAEDGHFIAVLGDVAPDGSRFSLSRGWLKASHREVDEGRSEPYRPFHPHTDPTPVTPGEITKYRIEIQPIGNRFLEGHRLRLEIWPTDYPKEEFDHTLLWGRGHHVPYAEDVTYEIYHDSTYPSHLLVPVVEG